MKGKEYPKPTLVQSIAAWHIVCDICELGYPHDFQKEMPHIRNYMYKVSDIVENAMAIKEGIEREEEKAFWQKYLLKPCATEQEKQNER